LVFLERFVLYLSANTSKMRHMTLRPWSLMTFDFGGHGACRWCGSSCSVAIPSLKFLVQKILRIYYVSI